MVVNELKNFLLTNELFRPSIIGIDGLGGSGKTTIANELSAQIDGAQLFHLDDFIHPKSVRYDDDFEEWYCYYHLQWRYDYLINKIFSPIHKGQPVNDSIDFYIKENDSYEKMEIDIPIGTTVIVEGVFLQRPELRKYFDFVIYINATKETRLKRVLERDVYIGNAKEIASKYERRYFPAEQKYLEQCKPLALANVIEDNVEERLV